MPRASCRPDPVELMLRNVLQRSLLLAGATALASCSSAHDADELGGDVGNSHEQHSVSDAGGTQPTGPVTNPSQDGGQVAGPKDAGAPNDAGRMDAGIDAAAATDAGADAFVPPANPGTLGSALSCAQGMILPIQASGLKPAQAYDYIALRRRSGVFLPPPDGGAAGESWTETNFQVMSEVGSKCATAQGPACADQVARHPQEFLRTGCVQLCWEHSLVTTRGDEVKRWSGADALKSMLGAIDSGDEALLLVDAAGYTLTCDNAEATSWRSVPEGYEVYATKITDDCAPIETTRFHLRVTRAGDVSVLSSMVLSRLEGACAGRKPAGLLSESRALGRSQLGDYLARIAHLEAASVFAFERLACELRDQGAPLGLIRAALEARADEVRHAHLIAELAVAHGGELMAPQIAELPARELEEIAIENAVEGCVRETFGALIGAYQAEHAEDAELKQAIASIAEDEARHAALSHRVQHWIEPRLGPAARERVRHARERAVFELAREIAVAEPAELRRQAGLPTPEMARILLEELAKTLWRAPFAPRGHSVNA